ncbi:uncharacterized protein LOC119741221 isoform X1 [Patiria miniata]|uniref:BEN domain-containing protein n=1 Tax=Patiria miniata TaxID=46514 RepID=A0A914B9W3_PATMI|nr:uncharacterized protein LOC119741221 isoform X1 [Patiria miniata]
MSLVNYYSSSDDESSNGEEKTEEKPNVEFRSVKLEEHEESSAMSEHSEERPRTKSSLFSTLPAPKSSERDVPEESGSFPAPATGTTSSSMGGLLNLPAPKKKSAQPIKITAPSLPEINSDDEDDEPVTKKAKPAKTKRNPGHRSLGSPVKTAIASHSSHNHLTGGDHLETRDRSPSGLDPSLLRKRKGSKETGEHTMEELLDMSRSAMEQLHQKLELQRQQMALLSGGGLSQMNSASLLAKGGPADIAVSSAAQLQGLTQALPTSLCFQGNPLLNASLHPGLMPLMQTHGLDLQTHAGLLGSQKLPFVSPVNASAVNHDLTKSLLNHFPFAPINPSSVGLQPFPLGSTMGISQPLAQPSMAPNTHRPSPPVDSNQEVHNNCCSACLKRIDLLEQKVSKISELLISKKLVQGSAALPMTNPFPTSTSVASQSASPQDTRTSLKINSSVGSSPIPSLSTAQGGHEFQNASMEAVHVETLSPCQSTALPRIVYPHQLASPPVPVKVALAAEHRDQRKSSNPPIAPKITQASANACPRQSGNLPVPVKITSATDHAYSSKTNDTLLLSKGTFPTDNDKYAYQSLMRYRGTSKLFMIDNELHQAQKSNQGSDDSGEDLQQLDALQFPLEIYSAADFESLPPKIQYILDVVGRDTQGKVNKLVIKEDILTSLAPYIKDRNSVSRRLADVMFTDDERCYCNCSGWRKPAALDPIRMQALTDAVFKLCPCPEEQKKHLWHECVKSIDAASRHIVRVRKNKGKMPRHGKWLPLSHQEQVGEADSVAALMGPDPSEEGMDYDNLPMWLQSVLNITHRNTNGKVCKVEIKEPVLIRFIYLSNSRLSVACQLADVLFTRAERKRATCLGRHGTRQLDPIRVDALREGSFRICPAPLTEQKQLWSYCMNAIDTLSVNPDMNYPTSSATLVHPMIKEEDPNSELDAFCEDGNQSTADD